MTPSLWRANNLFTAGYLKGLQGLLYIAGGVVLLQQIAANGATKALATIGSAVPPAELPVISGGVTAAVLAYYAWNILCIGLLVLVVGVRLY